mgnify:CR=1 FL=1
MIALVALLALSAPPTVVTAGTPPLSSPRYAFEPGAKQTIRLVMTQVATERVQKETTETVLPQTTVDIALTVGAVRDGQAAIEGRVLAIKVTPQKGTEAGAAFALQKGFDDGPPLVFVAHIGSAGTVDLALQSGLTPSSSTLDTIQMIIETLRGLWLALPSEPVGTGGRWRIQTTRDQDGMPITVTTDATLAASKVGLALDWTRSEQSTGTAPVKDAPKGMEVRYEAANTNAAGQWTLGPSGLPTGGKATSDGSLRMTGTSSGKPFTIELGERRTVTLTTVR